MSAPRRALLVSLVAVPVFAALPTSATASSAFTTAWAAYRPYSDASACDGLTDAATSAWCEAQGEATAALAEAPACSLVELEAKLAAGLYWFDNAGAYSGMTDDEADLLRSCLTDLRAIIAKAVAIRAPLCSRLPIGSAWWCCSARPGCPWHLSTPCYWHPTA